MNLGKLASSVPPRSSTLSSWLPWWWTKSIKWNNPAPSQVGFFSRLFITAIKTLSQTLCLYFLHLELMKGNVALNLGFSTLWLKPHPQSVFLKASIVSYTFSVFNIYSPSSFPLNTYDFLKIHFDSWWLAGVERTYSTVRF